MTQKEKIQRMRVVLPNAIADEICEQPPAAKAMLMLEMADDFLEKMDGFPALQLSATTTQWLRSLGKRDQLQLIENLAMQLMSELNA
jgi:hypothetical protein